ncbi:MAG TPA: flagellar basal body P-ring formation chaperone FlgA, partial [Bacillota bacterium]|nr:flagellar basal body P-ring formation chaperone FlgA [Bacillota bacterium]
LPVIKMGEQVIVRVQATEISSKEIAAAIEKLLPPLPAGIMKQWIQLKGLPEKLWLTQGNYRIEAAAIGELPALGRVLFKVQLSGEKETRVLNLSGIIRKSALVYRSKIALQPHTELKVADFEKVQAELVNGGEYLGGFPVQYRTVKRMRPGQVMSREAIQPVPLVAKGREVKVMVRGNGVLITLAGIATSDGWNGETITVINSDSKKEFSGRVIGKGIVEVTVE